MLDKENLTVLTDAISKIMNKESVTEEIEIELDEAYMIKHRNTGFLTKVGKDGNLMFKPSKKGAVKYKDQKAADDAMAGMIKDYAPYGGGTISVVKESTEITEKLKAAKGKSVLDIDFAGDDSEMDGMSKKYKIKMKKGKIKGTALVAGDNKNILAYLQSSDYEMDDENIMDIYPEVVAEAYDRNKLVNKMMKPIKDKEALKGKTKKEASGDKEAYQKFFMAALKKFGVESQAELKGDKEKEFYDYIDKNWDAKNEDLEEKQKPYVSSMDGKFDVLDAKGKVAFSTKNSKEAEKFLKVNYKMLMKETDEDLEESINEAKKVEASDNVYNLNNNQGQKPLRDYLNDRFKIPASKFLERIGFSGDTLVAGDKTVMNGVLSNKKLKVGDLVKALEKVLKKKAVKESVNENVGANGHSGPVQDIDQGLSPKAKLVKAFQQPETPDYADANKTALSTFANIMNSVNVAMDYRASDNKVQDVAPENTIQKLANSTK